jgi:hypothetical protein
MDNWDQHTRNFRNNSRIIVNIDTHMDRPYKATGNQVLLDLQNASG